MVVGPYERLRVSGGGFADFYLLRYGADGALLSPQTGKILGGALAGVTDVFLFSHGWNNTFDAAASRYKQFIAGYVSQSVGSKPGYRPLLIGVIWPSISFLLPWEDGPQIAADPLILSGRGEEMRSFVTESLDPDTGAEFSELVDGRTGLTAAEARRAAEIVRDGLGSGTDPDDGSRSQSVDELLAAWALLDGGPAAKPRDPDDFGDVGSGVDAGAPRAASTVGSLDPRNLLRVGTVWKMKDRAGKVGGRGVALLVRQVLDTTEARLHLVGHSFGARVLMSALAIAAAARPARSMLLLQPAVNRWCFAGDVDGTGRAGGYNSVIGQVELPILSTFSSHDYPLRQVFQLAIRGSSLGEPDIAAVGNTGRYGALGGYGPAGLGARSATQSAIAAGSGRYNLGSGARVIAVDGSGDINGKPAIGGHGDINNPTTWWALHCLTSAK
jgi:hypothetical protein